MKAEPLKNKVMMKREGHDWYTREDLELAVEWFKEQLLKEQCLSAPTLIMIFERLDKSFEDVIQK